MNVEELMLGDWVYGYDGEWKPICVKQIMGFHPSIVAVHTYGYQPDQIKPIPITPEILEKNGFVMAERDGVAVRYSFATDLHKPTQTAIQFAFYDGGVSADTLFKCWTSPKDCDGINDLHICDLKFVHEMQHALRLCGIEKEIVL